MGCGYTIGVLGLLGCVSAALSFAFALRMRCALGLVRSLSMRVLIVGSVVRGGAVVRGLELLVQLVCILKVVRGVLGPSYHC